MGEATAAAVVGLLIVGTALPGLVGVRAIQHAGDAIGALIDDVADWGANLLDGDAGTSSGSPGHAHAGHGPGTTAPVPPGAGPASDAEGQADPEDVGYGAPEDGGHVHARPNGESSVPGPDAHVENRSDPGEPPKRDGLRTAVVPDPRPAGLSTSDSNGICPDGAPERSFKIHAIEIDIVYNKYGQHDPDGRMYVLDENLQEVRDRVANAPNASIDDPNANATVKLVQPLTIRAHVGECVKIDFVNHLDQHASIHPAGVGYDVGNSDGSAVGDNPDTTAAPGEEVNYTWYVRSTGTFPFWDMAQQVLHDSDETLKQHGLFGSLIAYPKDQEWLDPKTGEPLRSGIRAMIRDPDGPDYRDFAVYYHDGADIVNADGTEPTWPHTNVSQSMYTMSYRGDPTGARLREDCPDCDKEKAFYSSWVHGDPGGGDLVYPAYVGDPVKYHLIGAQVEEKHVHHHHGHRFKSEANNNASNTIDSQTLSAGGTYNQLLIAGHGKQSVRPNMTFEEAFENGSAGYVQGSPGDYIFHCHLFPHYASGMWSLLRVFNKDTRNLTRADHPAIRQIQPLPDREDPPDPTDEEPGYPRYMPANQGELPPRPPLSGNGRQPTQLEETALNDTGTPGVWDGNSDPIKPGAPFSDPCPAYADVRRYNITAFKKNITYNDAGDFDPGGRMYALDKHVDDFKDGTRRPRPLAIRAHVGDCVEIRLDNDLGDAEEPNDMTIHVHFVGYDVQGSDGLTLGWNYDQGVEPGEDPIFYRWYADERGTIFWHDHHSGIQEGMHGTFGALIVEPRGTQWLDPYTGEEIEAGTQAMIVGDNVTNHREFVLWYQDFVETFDQAQHDPINPMGEGDEPFGPALEDRGVMGINYANAPLFHRNDADPAYAFSSWVHEDPQTPLLEAYVDDPIQVRLLQGTFEEAHNIMISGIKWPAEPKGDRDPRIASQVLGVSEQFVAQFNATKVGPHDLNVTDHLYMSRPVDDLWTGMWGLFRVWGTDNNDLEPLPGNKPPEPDNEKKFEKKLQSFNKKIEESNAPPEHPDDPGNPCPSNAPTRTYDVVAFRHDITYNAEFGDHDPNGIVFATRDRYHEIRNGSEAKPLVLRANAGDCIEVTLHNKLPDDLPDHDDHARVPVNSTDWNSSNRVSLAPTMVELDAQASAGITAGMNFDQTIGPGDNITYRWYADGELGTAVLSDFGDVRDHVHHGAYGLLIVEPKNSTWHDPATGEQIRTGTRAVIDPPGPDNKFREYAVAMADGQYIVNDDGSCVVQLLPGEGDGQPCNQAHGDPEDQGFKSINYAEASLTRRLNDDPENRERLVFSSDIHGEPATPVFRAFPGDPVRFRVGVVADKPRGMNFHLAGHQLPFHWTDPDVERKGVRTELIAGTDHDAIPVNGAGGFEHVEGDYYYGATKLRNYVEGGAWGIFDVSSTHTSILPLSDV